MELKNYRDAGYPAIAVETHEEPRLVRELIAALPDETQIWRIAAVGGLIDARTGRAIDPRCQYPAAWAKLADTQDAVLIASDWHHVCRQPVAYRSLLERLPGIKSKGAMAVLCAPSWSLPAELEHEIPVLEHRLPDRYALRSALDVVGRASGATPSDVDGLLDAARGLTLSEAENAYALAAASGNLDNRTIVEGLKAKLIRQTPGLEVWESIDPEQLGGLEPLREWLTEEVTPSRRDPQLRVKGGLLVGPPGTGKSLAARVSAALLGLPLVRLDVSACMGSLVGQSESQIRAALKIVEACAPAVLWIDEIDSALGGFSSSGQTDGGTTGRVVSTLLTWLQESEAEVFALATANYPERVPPAILRPGRLDAIWSVDLPSRSEREAIARVHLSRLGCEVDGHPQALAEVTADYSGAEIAAAVLSAARRTRREITRESLIDAASAITPLARSREEELRRMREWASTFARPANTQDTQDSIGRRIRESQ